MENQSVSLKQVRKLDERVFLEMLRLNCTLLCINEKKKKQKKISLKALYDNDREFWLRDKSDWSYFVSSDLVHGIMEDLKAIDLEMEKRLTIREAEIEREMSGEYNRFQDIPPEERLNALKRTLSRLNGIVDSRTAGSEEKGEALVEASYYSWLINKVTIDEVALLGDSDAKRISEDVARMTEKIVDSLTKVLHDDRNRYTYMHSLLEKSNGVTVRHMIRTFIMAHRFVIFFNREMNDKGLASRLRASFSTHYRKWYSALLPRIPEESLTLEHVFKGGIRPVPENELKAYSAGFLLHDIGKQRYIDYYEGDDEYDGRKVEAHAKTGYRMLLQKTVYSSKIAAIAGFHHEYYGHESGYGYYRELSALMRLENDKMRHEFCISYDLDDLNRFRSLAYLPVKFLEIVDVFDAVTDPGRSYKSHMTTVDALKFMRSDFVEKNRKLDLILFDLFVRFLQHEGPVV